MKALFALFLRSLRDETRARLPVFFRFVFVALILLIVWLNQRSFARQSAPGREFLIIVMMLNLGFIALLALSQFPSAITEEKEDETLPLLRMTNLSTLSILLGKGTSRLVGALLLLVVQVPFTVLAVTLGGVSIQQVWGAYTLLACTIFFLANAALFFSVLCRTTMWAALWMGVFGIVWFGALPIIGVVTTGMIRTSPTGFLPISVWDWVAQKLVISSPPVSLILLLEPRSSAFLSAACIWHMLAGGVVFFLLSWACFDRFCSTAGEVFSVRKKKVGEKGPRRWSRVPRPWWRLPLTWKDYHFLAGGRTGLILRSLVAVAIFVKVWLLYRWEHDTRALRNGWYYDEARMWEDIAGVVLAIGCGCAALEALLMAGRIFGSERQRLTLAGLVGLPWSVGKIIRQKVLGCLPVLLPWLALALVGATILWEPLMRDLRSLARDKDDLLAVIYVSCQGVLALVLTTWFSLRIRRGQMPVSLAILGLWNVLFALMIDEVFRRDADGGLMLGIAATVGAVAYCSVGIHRGIQRAAAVE